MLTSVLYTVLQGLAVIVMLVAMIVLLLGINILFHRDLNPDNDDTCRYRDEIANRDEVITSHSVFHDFIVNAHRDHRQRRMQGALRGTENNRKEDV